MASSAGETADRTQPTCLKAADESVAVNVDPQQRKEGFTCRHIRTTCA